MATIKQWRQHVRTPMGWAKSYIKAGNVPKVESNIADALRRLEDAKFAALRDTTEGAAFIAEILSLIHI